MRRIINCIRLVLGLRKQIPAPDGCIHYTATKMRRPRVSGSEGCFLPLCRKVGWGSESKLAAELTRGQHTYKGVKIGSSNFELAPYTRYMGLTRNLRKTAKFRQS